ncbi:MAG: carboxypeptidase-like regulatory domain-containing protein [Bacteroidota bacterium]
MIHRQEEPDIDNLEDLKYLLCPVLAQNQEQQQKFYRIFDEYFKRIKQKSLEDIEQEGERRDRYEGQKAAAKKYILSPKTTAGIIATCVIGGLVWLYLLLTALPPVPKASFKYIHPRGDTIAHEERIWRGRQGDTVSFIYHFDLDDDTAGISDVEFIWLYGDGTIDTIRGIEGMLTARQHMYQEVRSHEVQLIVRHRTHETVKAKTQQSEIQVVCRNPLEAFIQWLPKDPEEDEDVQFAFPLDTAYAEEDFDFLWDFGDESPPATSASPSHRYRTDGNKRIKLTVIRKIPSVQQGSACGDTATVSKFITISSNKPNIELTAEQYTLKTDDSALTAYSLTPLSIGLLAVGLTILILLLALLYRVLSHRKPQLASEDKYTSNRKGPYYIPFPKQDHLIAPDKGIYDLASVMRQRQRGNIHTVNLPMSIHKTIRESGMPIVHFDTSSRPSEYLVLIEKHHPQSHLARFFGRITEILFEQDVLLETFYYDKDPRKCWNEDYPDGLNLEQMRQRYSKHRLILFSDGHHLINPSKPILFRWVVPAFEIWRENRILLTPTPVVDWDYRERLIMEEMDVLPLDIPGQLHMIEMFDEIGQPAFEDHKDRMLRLFPAAACSVRSHHLTDVRGLSDYLFEYVTSGRELENQAQLSDQFFDYLSHKNSLPAQIQEDEGLAKQLEVGKHLFQWIASTAVYHTPRWEITLALGHKFSQKQSDYLLTFENLLVLARIPWLQSNDVPSRLRKDLLSMLDPETETTAREVLQKLLAEAQDGIKEGSSAARKMAIQSTTNNFFLEPDTYADEMYYLVQNGMVEDHEIEQRLEKPLDILAGQATYEYLHNRYGMLRQKEWLIGAISGLVLTAIFSFVLFDQFIQKSKTPFWLDQQDQEESIWVDQILDQDSAIIYHNIGVGAALNGELTEGRVEIEHAKDYRGSDSLRNASDDLIYPLADSNLNRLNYQLGVEKFNSKDFTAAINEFARIPTNAEDTLYRHSLAGLGLGHYFLDDTTEYKRYVQDLVERGKEFVLENYPLLYSLYDHDDLDRSYTYHIDLAKSYFTQRDYPKTELHVDSALLTQPGDSVALALRQLALDASGKSAQPIVNLAGSDSVSVDTSFMPFVGHEGAVWPIAFSSGGQSILTGSRDNTARLWTKEGRQIQIFEGHTGEVTSVDISLEADQILTGSKDQTAKLWNQEGQELGSFIGHTREISSVAFSFYGRSVLTGSYDNTAKLWDLKGKLLQTFAGHKNWIFSVDFSPDPEGKYILTGSRDNTAKMWDLEGNEIQTFQGHTGPVWSAVFSPDGQYVLTGSEDATAKLWTLDGKEIRSFEGHSSWVLSVAFSPDGTKMMTASRDNAAKLWDIRTAEIIQEYGSSVGEIRNVEFSPDGNFFAFSTGDKIEIFPVPQGSGTKTETISDPLPPLVCLPVRLNMYLDSVASALERQKIMYNSQSPEKLEDASGIFFRMVNAVKDVCPENLYPDPVQTPDTRSIARWYDDNNNLALVQDPMASRNWIKAGSVMFFGLAGKKYSNATIDDLVRVGGISHIGVVTEVIKDDNGDVKGYALMHGQKVGKTAGRTHYHNVNPPRLGYPVLGNRDQQWLAIANISTSAESEEVIFTGQVIDSETREALGGTYIRIGAVTHTVKKGETLFSINRKYGVKIDEIKSLSGMKSNTVKVGQVLTIQASTDLTTNTDGTYTFPVPTYALSLSISRIDYESLDITLTPEDLTSNANAGQIQLKRSTQNKTIIGKVTDASGEALIGATILVRGTSLGTTTDIDGNYNLTLPYGGTELEISYTGYNNQIVSVGGRSVIDITLQSGAKPKAKSDPETYVGPRTITGTVTGVSNRKKGREPLIGASVLVKGTATGTITDSSGKFSIDIPAGSTTLVVSMKKFKTQEVDITGKTKITITLE